jgi:hypothetical protein
MKFVDQKWQQLLRRRPGQGDVPAVIPADHHMSYQSLAAQFPDLIAKLKFDDPSVKWKQWFKHTNLESNSAWPQIDGKPIPQVGVLAMQTFKNPKTLSLRELMIADEETTFVLREIPTVGEANYIELALAECDSKDALSMVRQAARAGQWAVIEKLLPGLQPKETFCLVLTTEATPSFPAVLLQSAAKIAYEAPPGLLNQIKRTLMLWNEDWCLKQQLEVRVSLMFLAYLHGVFQDRRAYLPVGCSQFFEFTQADLNAGSQIIEQRNSAMDIVRGLIETTV